MRKILTSFGIHLSIVNKLTSFIQTQSNLLEKEKDLEIQLRKEKELKEKDLEIQLRKEKELADIQLRKEKELAEIRVREKETISNIEALSMQQTRKRVSSYSGS